MCTPSLARVRDLSCSCRSSGAVSMNTIQMIRARILMLGGLPEVPRAFDELCPTVSQATAHRLQESDRVHQAAARLSFLHCCVAGAAGLIIRIQSGRSFLEATFLAASPLAARELFDRLFSRLCCIPEVGSFERDQKICSMHQRLTWLASLCWDAV